MFTPISTERDKETGSDAERKPHRQTDRQTDRHTETYLQTHPVANSLLKGTFIVNRIMVLAWMTRWIVINKDAIPLFLYTLGW